MSQNEDHRGTCARGEIELENHLRNRPSRCPLFTNLITASLRDSIMRCVHYEMSIARKSRAVQLKANMAQHLEILIKRHNQQASSERIARLRAFDRAHHPRHRQTQLPCRCTLFAGLRNQPYMLRLDRIVYRDDDGRRRV